jgi:hypothetical protein
VLPLVRELITDCWATDPDDRPPFRAFSHHFLCVPDSPDSLTHLHFMFLESVSNAEWRACCMRKAPLVCLRLLGVVAFI